MRGTIPDGGGPVERKVQMTGGSTYTVSIPKSWAQSHEIDTGAIVQLYPFDDRLVIAHPDGRTPEVAVVNVDAVEEGAIDQRIVAAYAAGADRITVETDTEFTASQRRVTNRSLTGLVGMEIADEDEREIVARSLLDPAELSLEATNSQLRQVALSMHENAIEAVVSEEDDDRVEEMATHVVSRDDDADRLFALVCRQFYRVLADVRAVAELQTSRLDALTQFRIARQLERVADHAERIATVGTRQTSPPDPALADEFETTAADARRVVRAALDGKTGAALLHRDELLERLDDLDRMLYESRGADVYLYGRVLESVRRTAEYGGNVAEHVTLAEITGPGP